MSKKKTGLELFLIVVIAALAALNYQLFVFPNTFAPAGVDGICTMICYLTHTEFAFLALLCNVPLLAVGWFLLSRDFCVKTTVYVLAFALANLIFGRVDLSLFQYHTDTGTSIVLAPVAAGVIRGLLYSATLRLDATSGGTDIVAALIQRKNPAFHFMTVVFGLNTAVALLAYFVYGFQFEPVICSILYSYLAATVSGKFTRWSKKINQGAVDKEKARL